MFTQFKKGALELCVLALICRRDCYGYEIVETISKAIDVSEGTIYPLLRRLVIDGSCRTYLQESTEGPPRKYYSITEAGRLRTEELRRSWLKFTKQVDMLIQEKENT